MLRVHIVLIDSYRAVRSQAMTKNPHVFLDISADGKPVGRVIIELNAEKGPKTTANFLALCTGSHRKDDDRLHYSGTKFFRIVSGTYVCGGDVINNNGTGGLSIYGSTFPDEMTAKTELKHDSAGVLSMANHGPNSNGSQFFITVKPTPWMDGFYVPFGKVIKGLELLEKVCNEYGTESGIPKSEHVRIVECGQLE